MTLIVSCAYSLNNQPVIINAKAIFYSKCCFWDVYWTTLLSDARLKHQKKLLGREQQTPNESSCCLIWSTFSTAEKLRLASTLPLWNEPQLLPCGSPKLAYWISEMILRPPLHDNSNVVPSYVFPHIVSVAVIWKETSEGFPPISSNKINVFEPLLRNDLGTWYLIQCHPLNTWS